MPFCKYCGEKIEEQAEICPHCGKELNKNNPEQTAEKTEPVRAGQTAKMSGSKKTVITAMVAAVALIVGVFILPSGGKCKWSGCSNKAVSGSDYCYNHKCAISGCMNKRSISGNYCYEHSYYDDDEDEEEVDNSVEVAARLRISDIKLDTYSSDYYIRATGRITNNSSYTVRYVKIKGAFETYSGKVVDTDWTYAVDSAGLEPGESCKWELSVKKDSRISDCTISIIDLEVD